MISRPTSAPLLHDIAREIRTVAKIWHITKTDDGLLFRAEMGHRQFRVFVSKPGLPALAEVPVEKGSPVHLVTDLLILRRWLRGI
ncbi:hypothetical protein GCM10027190_61570 [Spirosoma areae]